jgi:hypothetical protein
MPLPTRSNVSHFGLPPRKVSPARRHRPCRVPGRRCRKLLVQRLDEAEAAFRAVAREDGSISTGFNKRCRRESERRRAEPKRSTASANLAAMLCRRGNSWVSGMPERHVLPGRLSIRRLSPIDGAVCGCSRERKERQRSPPRCIRVRHAGRQRHSL